MHNQQKANIWVFSFSKIYCNKQIPFNWSRIGLSFSNSLQKRQILSLSSPLIPINLYLKKFVWFAIFSCLFNSSSTQEEEGEHFRCSNAGWKLCFLGSCGKLIEKYPAEIISQILIYFEQTFCRLNLMNFSY